MRLIKFLFGLSVGAAAGVLFAPKSGRELRRQLRESDLVNSVTNRLLPSPPAQVSAPEAAANEDRPSGLASDQAESAAAPSESVEAATLPETAPVDVQESAAEFPAATVVGVAVPLTEPTRPEPGDALPPEAVVWEERRTEQPRVDTSTEEAVQPIDVVETTVEEPPSGVAAESPGSAVAKALSGDERDASAAFAAEVAEVETPLEPSAWAPVETAAGLPVAESVSESAEEVVGEEAPPEVAPQEEAPQEEAEPPLEEAEAKEMLAEATEEAGSPFAAESVEHPSAVEQAEAAALTEEPELLTPPAEEPSLTEVSAEESSDVIESPAESVAGEVVLGETESETVATTEAVGVWPLAPVPTEPLAPLAPEPSMWAPIEIAREPMAQGLTEPPPAPPEEASTAPAPPEATTESLPDVTEWLQTEEETPAAVVEPSGVSAEEAPGLTEPPAEAPADGGSAIPAVESDVAEAARESEDSATPALHPETEPYPAEDLLTRIEATRAALAADLAAPFGGEPGEAATPDAQTAGSLTAAAAPTDVSPSTEPAQVAPSLEEEGPSVAEAPALAAEPPPASDSAVPAAEETETPSAAADLAPAAAAAQAEHLAPSGAPLEGGTIDQAEMRRRIEETRARLKAKAFDAMMSGESALLRHGTGTRPVPTAPDTRVEPEIDSTIDKSLTQEDF